jgi:hypothetical protein
MNIQALATFIQPRHLEIQNDRLQPEKMEQAFQYIDNLDSFKTPKGKLNLLINFAKIIVLMLSDTNKKNEADGADLFLPAQILCLFGCKNVRSLKTELNYIKAFRQEHLL